MLEISEFKSSNLSSLLIAQLLLPFFMGLICFMIFQINKIKKNNFNFAKTLVLIFSLFPLVLNIILFQYYNDFFEKGIFSPLISLPWIKQLGINFIFALDSVSYIFLLISSILYPLIVIFAWENTDQTKSNNSLLQFGLFFLLLTPFQGAFMALDMISFYLCWELVLIPIFILMGVWGQEGRKIANIRFLIYSFFGSLLMLTAMVLMAIHVKDINGEISFNYFSLKSAILPWNDSFLSLQGFAFIFFLISFFIKGHVFPFHGWLVPFYRFGTTLTTLILGSLLFNMATYSMLRFLPSFFPNAFSEASSALLLLGVAGVIFGALCTFLQSETRSIIAYMSVSHMGFFLLGLGSISILGLQAAYVQTINHGILALGIAAVFFTLATKFKSFDLNDYGGVVTMAPLLTLFSFIIILGNLGLPGTNGFVGEFLVLLASSQKWLLASLLGGLGIILGAVYLLNVARKTFWGNISDRNRNLVIQLTRLEIAAFSFIALLVIYLGLFPMNVFKNSWPSIAKLLAIIS